LHLTPYELCFGRKPTISHFKPVGCKCFVQKRGNLDKFEFHYFDGILLGYTPHGRSYRVYNFETNTVVESCDGTFNETAPSPHGVFECAGDKEMEESIYVDDGLQASMMMKMNHYFHLHHHPSLFLFPHLKQRLLHSGSGGITG
jgi:hypothetical protein